MESNVYSGQIMPRLRAMRPGDMELWQFVTDKKLNTMRAVAAKLKSEGYAFEMRRAVNQDAESVIVRRKRNNE